MTIKSKAFKFLLGIAIVVGLGLAFSASAYDFGAATLRVGSRGADVMEVQRVVGANPVDGIFGPMTKAAVEAWQVNRGLTPDGIVGPATKAAMSSSPLLGTFPAGCTSNEGFSSTTGLSCAVVVGTLPAGCTSTAGFSPTTGQSCSVVTTLPAGCTSTVGYSPTTGVKCDGGSTTGTTGPLMGGAGDSDYASYSTGVKSSIKDGEENVKVAGLKIEAIDSDIQVNSLKVEVKTSGTVSTKVSKYVESIDVYMGSTKVGSVDADDLSKDGTVYYKSINLSNAIVRADQKEAFFVVFNAANDIDDANDGDDLLVDITSYRFTDATGVVMTTDVTYTAKSVELDLLGANDVTLKSASSNPTNTTVAVDEDKSTDDVLALTFKIDNDEDSTDDVTLISLPVLLTFTDNTEAVAVDWVEQVIETVTVKIDGSEFEAELTSDDTTALGAGTAIYTVDLDGEDVVIEKGDTAEVKVYITFAEQDGNYASGMTVKAEVDASEMYFEDEDEDSVSATGTKAGGVLTLSVSPALITGLTATSSKDSNSKIGTFSFKFTVEADGSDVDLATADFDYDVIGGAATATFSILKNSGTAVTNAPGEDYTVEDGNTATFTVTYTIDPEIGQAGTYAVTLNSIAGVTVDETPSSQSLVE